MASSFKIPKKKQSAGSDLTCLHMQSPLSRLQNPDGEFKSQSYGDQSSRGGRDKMHSGSWFSATVTRRSVPCKPCFGDVVKTLLGLSPGGRASTANHSRGGGQNSQSQEGQKAEPSVVGLSNGWRPKRASDRLLQPDMTSERASPPQKKKSGDPPTAAASITVDAVDVLAELRGEGRAGSVSSSPIGETARRKARTTQEQKGSSLSASDHDDDFLSPRRHRSPPSSVTSLSSLGTMPDRRRSLNRTSWHMASGELEDEQREREREQWRAFRDRKSISRSAVLRLRPKRKSQSEPIVLSSEDEEDGGEGRMSRSGNARQPEWPQVNPYRAELQKEVPPPSFLELDFTSLHAGLTHVDANKKMMITANGVTLPLKGEEEGEVTVVASEVRGYGVWDGGVAQGGALFYSWEGPAPSLLFLWVTDAQANMLQRELTAIQTAATATGPACSFLLLVLKEQLQELQAALLASILDMEEFRRGRCSSPGGPASPLDWSDGLLLLHSCPPPLDQHLLRLLGRSTDSSISKGARSSRKGCVLHHLPARLIQYPAAPSKGRISVTKEDLACLNAGEFLNDVIIDFYLKFLLLEGVAGTMAGRSHVFSSFFYKQLSRRRVAGEDAAASVPDRHTRHQRVKTWTRNVDIFTKDFLFVPVNQEAHWFLAVVCFAGLEEVQYEERTWESDKAAVGLRSSQPPDCTQQGFRKDAMLKRPCILIMDSLKLTQHDNVCRLLRDYLQVEWQVRRGKRRLFTADSMPSCSCRVPQQDNSSDCGLYLLQYTESFLQNPVVHFDLPLRLENWFPRQKVRQKREEIRRLIMRLHTSQQD